jgi:two-component system, NarL family, nitrate/nitrite response regulator NarL
MTQSNGKHPSAATNVYVVAENRLLRETLVRLFRKRGDMCIVGENSCSDCAAEQIAFAESDLLLMDCLNAGHKSQDLVRELRESVPDIKVLLFGMDEDPEVFLRAVRLGVNGYVLKNASAAELFDAVRLVAQGDAVCPVKFCKVLFQAIADFDQKTVTSDERASRFVLTQRQRQLMSLVAMGLSNKEIAVNLNLSEFTVKNHIYRIMKQVDAQNRHEAVTLIRASASGSSENEWRGVV